MSSVMLVWQALISLFVVVIAQDTSCVAPGRGYVSAHSFLQTHQSRTLANNADNFEKNAFEENGNVEPAGNTSHKAAEELRDPDLSLPGKCGFNAECPRDYNLTEVNSTTDPSQVENNTETLARLHDTQRKACEASADEKNAILETGGWCYDIPKSQVVNVNGTNVDMDYRLPLHHVVADEVLVSTLSESVLLKEDGSCCHSLTDLGAGVGQYGHALRARLPKLEYYGYDGAGNVEEFTNNYVKFVDLTQPLNLKQTDWVLSAEVGEHIPHKHEAQVIANIHAHNCKGVILTWAVPGQGGNGHINCHSNQYLIQIFEELGYTLNKDLSAALRAPRTGNQNWWFLHSAMAFDRITKPASCNE